jgi:DNA-binding LacI/PurR family transcriptional regulator
MVTTKEIAAALGVAVSTVGRALADDPRISEATKVLVREMASELGYIGSVPARIMRGASSRLVALMVPNIMNDFYATIAQELSQHCDAQGCQLALSIHGERSEIELKRIRELLASRVAGIVIVPTATPLDETLRLLGAIPHVQLLRRVPSLKGDWFGIQDEAALDESTAYLLKRQHRRIAYVGGLESNSTGHDRLAGFRRAHRAARIPPRTSLVHLGPPTEDFGFEATTRILKRRHPPTAIVYGSIQATVGGINAIESNGTAVPGELSVMGFGDPIWFQWWGPGLSTIRLPMRELAQAFGTRFLQRLEAHPSSQSAGAAFEDARAATLVIRGSVIDAQA